MFVAKIYLLLAILITRIAAFDATSNKNVAVYWGQNSYGSQKDLASYCDSSDIDIVLLSFLTSFPSLQLNFANACYDTFSDGLLHCTAIAEGIKKCQQNGKKVLLSMGGASGSYGFSSDDEATTFATTLWNKFGGGSDSERPFDDAIVDGFDFDLENHNQVGTVALGKKLRELYAADTSKSYYLSAAPQCPYPDASVGDLLAGVDLDFSFIQFYNNYCNLGSNFNWDTWLSYAQSTSPNKNIKLYVGLPGASSSAGSGYADIATVEKYVTSSITSSSSFGGFSLWDASSGFGNTDSNGNTFVHQLKSYLEGSSLTSTATTLSTSTTSAQTATTDTTGDTTTSTTSTKATTSSTSTTSTKTDTTSSTSTKPDTTSSTATTLSTSTIGALKSQTAATTDTTADTTSSTSTTSSTTFTKATTSSSTNLDTTTSSATTSTSPTATFETVSTPTTSSVGTVAKTTNVAVQTDVVTAKDGHTTMITLTTFSTTYITTTVNGRPGGWWNDKKMPKLVDIMT